MSSKNSSSNVSSTGNIFITKNSSSNECGKDSYSDYNDIVDGLKIKQSKTRKSTTVLDCSSYQSSTPAPTVSVEYNENKCSSRQLFTSQTSLEKLRVNSDENQCEKLRFSCDGERNKLGLESNLLHKFTDKRVEQYPATLYTDRAITGVGYPICSVLQPNSSSGCCCSKLMQPLAVDSFCCRKIHSCHNTLIESCPAIKTCHCCHGLLCCKTIESFKPVYSECHQLHQPQQCSQMLTQCGSSQSASSCNLHLYKEQFITRGRDPSPSVTELCRACKVLSDGRAKFESVTLHEDALNNETEKNEPTVFNSVEGTNQDMAKNENLFCKNCGVDSIYNEKFAKEEITTLRSKTEKFQFCELGDPVESLKVSRSKVFGPFQDKCLASMVEKEWKNEIEDYEKNLSVEEPRCSTPVESALESQCMASLSPFSAGKSFCLKPKSSKDTTIAKIGPEDQQDVLTHQDTAIIPKSESTQGCDVGMDVEKSCTSSKLCGLHIDTAFTPLQPEFNAPLSPIEKFDKDKVVIKIEDSEPDADSTVGIEQLACWGLPEPEVPGDPTAATPVLILHFIDPSDFYVSIATPDSCDRMARFLDEVNDYYCGRAHPRPGQEGLPVGTHWAVLDRDKGCWCRARVLANCLPAPSPSGGDMDSEVRFHLVDHGGVVGVSVADVRVLHDMFTTRPPYALHAALAKLSPPPGDAFQGWSEESCRAFLAFCGGPLPLTAYFVPPQQSSAFSSSSSVSLDGRHDLVLETPEGVVVNEALVSSGLASSSLLRALPFLSSATEQALSSVEESLEPSNANDFQDEQWDPMLLDHRSATNHPGYREDWLEMVTLGTVNDDAERQCRFYRSGRPCPRGDACRWEHTRPRKDGLPCKRVSLHFDLSCTPQLPGVGTLVFVVISAVTHPSCFYVFMPFGPVSVGEACAEDSSCSPAKNLEDLCEEMDEVYAGSYPSVGAELPALGQIMAGLSSVRPLATASLQTQDVSALRWYRVRVLEMDRAPDVDPDAAVEWMPTHLEGEYVKVFFLDLGCCRWLHEVRLRNIEPVFVHSSPLVVECYLHGVQPHDGGYWSAKAADLLRRVARDEQTVLVASVVDVDRGDSRIGVDLAWHRLDGGDTSVSLALCLVGERLALPAS